MKLTSYDRMYDKKWVLDAKVLSECGWYGLDVGPRLVRMECGLAGLSESTSGPCCELGKGWGEQWVELPRDGDVWK